MPKQTPEAKKIIRDAVRIFNTADVNGKVRIRANANTVIEHGISTVRPGIQMGITTERMAAVLIFLRIIQNK